MDLSEEPRMSSVMGCAPIGAVAYLVRLALALFAGGGTRADHGLEMVDEQRHRRLTPDPYVDTRGSPVKTVLPVRQMLVRAVDACEERKARPPAVLGTDILKGVDGSTT
jgi:hypothetical protein